MISTDYWPGRAAIAALCAVVLLGACGWKNNSIDVGREATPASQLSAEKRMEPARGELQYLLQPGDVLDIKFFYNPELNENSVIRPDGGITLQLVGDVLAAGRTTAGLSEVLQKRYAKSLRRPEVTVIVRKYGAQRVYVSGEVQNPGPISLDGNELTALQAIMAAGGFRYSAARDSVVLLRNEGTGQPLFVKLDLQSHLEQRSLDDMRLHPSDIVYVPQTEIGEAAQFFELYVNKILPIYRNLGFYFTYEVSPQPVKVQPQQ